MCYSDIIMQVRTPGVTAESTVLALHQVPYSGGEQRDGLHLAHLCTTKVHQIFLIKKGDAEQSQS